MDTTIKSHTSSVRITGPVEHAALLHAANRPGKVALAQRKDGWKEQAYTLSELPDVLAAVAGESDVYLSTQRFWGWRRIAQLAECGALAMDVDFHKRPELQDMHPMGVLDDALILLERSRMPAPSLAISSGRGLYLLWIHHPIPRAALPRWNATQRRLWEVLKPLGADRGALDAARVLRLVGTRHSKAGVMVEALTPSGDVWDFDDLAQEILPLDRAELHDLRVQRAARRPQKRSQRSPEGFTQATLWEARLSDLQALKRLRWFGDLPPGQRDHWLFIAGNAMSWLAEPAVLRRELHALAHEVGGWDDRESQSRLHAIFKRAHMAAKGQLIEWNGAEVDPRYRFTNDTIMEWLEITPEEERQMLTLIGADERRRRDRERKEAERRRAGMKTREEYEGRAQDRRQKAQQLREEGLSYSKIARTLGVSKPAVIAMLKPTEGGGSKSVRLYGGVASPEGGLGAEGPAVLSGTDRSIEEGNPDILRDVSDVFGLALTF